MTDWEIREIERQEKVRKKYENKPNEHLIGVLKWLKTGHTVSLLQSKEEFLDLLWMTETFINPNIKKIG